MPRNQQQGNCGILEDMTTAAEPVRLIPLAGIRDLLAGLMKGREHLSQEPYVTRDATGWRPAAPLAPDKGLRLPDFLAALTGLPDPAPEDQAITALGQVFRQRGSWYLIREIDDGWQQRWPDTADAVPAVAASRYGLKCQRCGGPIPEARGPKARYCSASHRVMASRDRVRAR